MSMTVNVQGIMRTDARWEAMFRIYEACQAASVPVPPAVRDFFNGQEPVREPVVDLWSTGAVERWWSEEDSPVEGIQIDVSKLPTGLRLVHVFEK